MRCHFHLVSDHMEVVDEVGLDLPDLETAKIEALRALYELWQEITGSDEDWRGWRLNIACSDGSLLYSLNLHARHH